MASLNLEHGKKVKHATLKFGKLHLLSAEERAHATNEVAVGPAIEKSPRANHEAAHADNGPSYISLRWSLWLQSSPTSQQEAALLADMYVG